MRPKLLIALGILAVATTAHAETLVPFTITGTQYVDAYNGDPSDPSSLTYAFTLSEGLTGTGYYDVDFSEIYLDLNTYIPVEGGGSVSDYYDLINGHLSSDVGALRVDIDFNYNPSGLSTGSFDYSTDEPGSEYDPATNQISYGRLFYYGDGTLTQAVTPEPSTFALLGTGLLGMAGAFRRRVA